jgi:cupin 2 domain-containing protein
MKNLLTDIPGTLPDELFDTLVDTPSVCIQRIVSRGHITPGDDWYDQDTNEFVVLLKGAATLEFEKGRVVGLEPGDWLQIPAHEKHRVAWTDENSETVWLAVHYT